MARRKALLIGINYTGSANQLAGCHQDVHNMVDYLRGRGWPTDERSMLILADDRPEPFAPTGRNILSAIHWLVSEPDCQLFLHYSGHGGQVRDPDGDRDSGFDDTIVPVDFERNGQIDSDTLHRQVVSALPPTSSLFVIFDCCHSGSAMELPFVYQPDANGNVNVIDNVKQGLRLVSTAGHLLQGGFSLASVQDARQLMAGAQSFFQGFQHRGKADEHGLGEERFQEGWRDENKQVVMFSGCRDDQTSADAVISSSHVGAMSWAFLESMKQNPDQSFIEVLQNTRQLLYGRYTQIPQLSIGARFDLNQPVRL